VSHINEGSTVGTLENYLLFHMDLATDDRSKINPSLTREQVWNVFMGALMGKGKSATIHPLGIRNMINEFGSYYED